MKLAKPILLSTAIAGILASPAAAALSATATTELNLRSGPGPEYQIEGVIPGDAEVEVTGCLEEAEWCEVTHEGVSGWAYSAYLTTPVENEPVVLYQRPAEVQIDTVTYDKTEGQGVAAGLGAGWGAAIGSLAVGGPAAIAAGALIGAATGAAAQVEQETVTYIQTNPVEPVYLDGEVAVGAGIPEQVELYTVPDSDYTYVNVNRQPVVVDPENRRIVQVIR
ncbi:DUF1236 domain-containing protein [uncultured Salipiger sp.]|uniref:DUF1236 domain-containing protein n=1 Tax=uncultured Salipiger sp. TaxID=499810 RepID=UPI0025940B0D|nr:DUF1236 domain-containing protein [uncultured Salipiger sp.]